MLTAVGAIAVVLQMLVPGAPLEPGPPGCAVVDSIGRCLVIAADPARPGGPRDEAGPAPATRDAAPREASTDATAPVAPPRPQLEAMPFGDTWRVGEAIDPADFLDPEPATAVAAEAAPAAVLAQRAIELLTLDQPALRTSTGGSGFVGVPVWLWIQDDAAAAGPVSATAAAGAARVTATARLARVEWSMGPPGALVGCDGPGTPWAGQSGPSPDCGYVYEQRSLPERTSGTGAWEIVATAVWTVAWSGVSGGEPVDGQETVEVPATTTLEIGEIQVLVTGEAR